MTDKVELEPLEQACARIGVPGPRTLGTALKEHLHAAGYVIMPREPTEAMLTAAHAKGVTVDQLWARVSHDDALTMKTGYLPTAYRAMIEAAE